ncbi:DUF2726 domain-containing protein [Pseudonocardia sp. Cha107L01]|uniref:DUF2726 domain-containing protein n=1 Tax=Pseudonocardia sp. Cha107L01 TaxID=3457576 RepID=UPI00403E9F81
MRDRRKKVLNNTEYRVDQILADYADQTGYRINLKMRLRDALDIDDLALSGEDRNFLWTSHLDFVAIDTSTQLPVLAIEYDGPMHDDRVQVRRDLVKDRLCRDNGLQMLRLDSNFARKEGKWVVLKYILWAHEVGKAFYKAQESGYIPEDEPFYHGSVVEVSDDGKGYGFAGIDMPAIRYLHSFRQAHSCVWQRQWWRSVGLEVESVNVVSLPNSLYLVGRCRMRNFALVGISAHDISQELSTAELGWLAHRYSKGEAVAIGKKDGDMLLGGLVNWNLSMAWGADRTS